MINPFSGPPRQQAVKILAPVAHHQPALCRGIIEQINVTKKNSAEGLPIYLSVCLLSCLAAWLADFIAAYRRPRLVALTLCA